MTDSTVPQPAEHPTIRNAREAAELRERIALADAYLDECVEKLENVEISVMRAYLGTLVR